MNHEANGTASAFRRWLREYPFQLFATFTFLPNARPPRDEDDFGRFHARIGKALKVFGKRVKAPVCALGVVVVTQAQMVHSHNLIWAGNAATGPSRSQTTGLLDRCWPHISLTEPIRSPEAVAAYISAQQQIHGARFTDLFHHGPDWLTRIRGSAAGDTPGKGPNV